MWPSYVINLADNTARLDAVTKIMTAQDIAFERVEGVNGWALTEAEIARTYDAKRNAKEGRHPLVPAEIGCYLSHIAAWQRIADGDAAGGFIFEDDFDATAQLGPVLRALSADTAGDWDMTKLFTLDTFVWETGLRVALVLPPPVVLGDQQTVTGTVGRARRTARRGGFVQFLHRARYALRYRLALARHRRREGWRT